MNKDIDKKGSRLRRARRGRMKARELNAPRLTVYRSPRHIYAQIVRFQPDGDRILAQASTLDKALRGGSTGNVAAATAVGELIAERAAAAGIETVALRSLRLQIPRPRQGAGRSGPRRRA